MDIKKIVNKYDPQNQFKTLVETYKQIEYAWGNDIELNGLSNENIKNIIVTGLGGSAIAGDVINNFLKDDLHLPLFVNRSYNLPLFADENTLLLVSSYSGTTEETLSVLKEGLSKNCKIVCISTGGEVKEIAEKNNLPFAALKKGFQPRFALGLSFFSLLKVLQELKLIKDHSPIVSKLSELWKRRGEEYSQPDNAALNYAAVLCGFIPLIYSSENYSSAGYRWKCQFNENSKVHSFAGIIPEMNHNEIIGWETFQEQKFYTKLIHLYDDDVHPQIKKRFSVVENLFSDKKIEVLKIKSDQDSFKTRLMDLIYLGDWISYYLSLLRGFDPTEIKYINHLKEQLK